MKAKVHDYTQDQFYEDLSWIGQMARGYVVREVFEKWKGRINFTDKTQNQETSSKEEINNDAQ